MKLELTDEQRAMVESVRQLAQEKFRARVHKWQDGTFPFENIKELADLGVLGMAVPEEFGGLGLPVLDCVLVLEEIGKVCYVTAMAVMSAMGAQNRIIANYAPKHVQEKFLPGVVSGEVILAICMTEPHAGTDVANYRTNTDDQGRHGRAQRRQDADQPGRRGALLHRLHPRRRQAGPRGHRLHARRPEDAGVRGHRRGTTPWAARTSPRSSSTTSSCRARTSSSRATASRSC